MSISRPVVRAWLVVSTMALAWMTHQGTAQAGGKELTVVDTTASPPVEIVLSEAQLNALEQQTLVTKTDYTDGPTTFIGPLVIDVMALVGQGPWETARMIAANDYAVEIPVSDFKAYDVILAHTMNGKPLSRRDKGPYWIMYPLDSHVELQDPLYNNRLIWQLKMIELR